jgi:hypothetical protein
LEAPRGVVCVARHLRGADLRRKGGWGPGSGGSDAKTKIGKIRTKISVLMHSPALLRL